MHMLDNFDLCIIAGIILMAVLTTLIIACRNCKPIPEGIEGAADCTDENVEHCTCREVFGSDVGREVIEEPKPTGAECHLPGDEWCPECGLGAIKVKKTRKSRKPAAKKPAARKPRKKSKADG